MLLTGPISHTSTQYMELSKFSIFHWICLPFILLILVGLELPLCVVEPVFWSQLSIRSFCFILPFCTFSCLLYFLRNKFTLVPQTFSWVFVM